MESLRNIRRRLKAKLSAASWSISVPPSLKNKIQACASLEGMTFTVLEGLVDPDPDVNSSLAGPRVGGSSGRCSEGSSLTSTAATVPEGTGIEPEESKAQQGGSGQSSGGLSTGGSLQEVAYSVRGGERTDPPSLGGAFERCGFRGRRSKVDGHGGLSPTRKVLSRGSLDSVGVIRVPCRWFVSVIHD